MISCHFGNGGPFELKLAATYAEEKDFKIVCQTQSHITLV